MLDTWVDFSFLQSFNIVYQKRIKDALRQCYTQVLSISWISERAQQMNKKGQAHTQVI